MQPLIEARHLISPNVHAILVHAPLGLFMFGLFLEVFGLLMFRKSQVRQAGRWMLLFGGLMAVPAALSGVDAYHDVTEHGTYAAVDPETHKAMKPQKGVSTAQWEYMRKHVLYTGFGAGIAALGVTAGLGLSRRRLGHAPTYSILLLMMLGSATLMGVGAHFAGEAVYLQSLAVGVKIVKADPKTLEFFAPSRETHIALAGVAIAIALGALGATLRLLSGIGQVRNDDADERELAALTSPATSLPPEPQPFGQRKATDDMLVARTLNKDAELGEPRTPAARFWVLSTLVFVAAFFFGAMFLMNQEWSGSPDVKATPAHLKELLTTTATHAKHLSENKQGLHIVIGLALAAFPLLLAFAARFLARARWLVASLCLVMLLLIFAEVWLGVLLSYRGATGPIYKFPAAESVDNEQ